MDFKEKMKALKTSNAANKGRLLAIMCVTVLVFGCQTLSFDPRGHTVPEAKRIAIPGSGEQRGIYRTEDLTLTYKMVRTPGLLTISGEIHFADRIAENFPVIQYFHLDAILIDAQGKVQNMAGLTSTAYYHTEYITPSDYPPTFNTPITVTENTKSVAFSYTGKAFDATGSDGGGMDFWEYPVY
jgi:hypothetical protein